MRMTREKKAERDFQIMKMYQEGMSKNEIASWFSISVATVRGVIKSMDDKTDITIPSKHGPESSAAFATSISKLRNFIDQMDNQLQAGVLTEKEAKKYLLRAAGALCDLLEE